jgi:hypothetical protein
VPDEGAIELDNLIGPQTILQEFNDFSGRRLAWHVCKWQAVPIAINGAMVYQLLGIKIKATVCKRE